MKQSTKLKVQKAYEHLYALLTEDEDESENLQAQVDSLTLKLAKLTTELANKKKFIAKWMAEAQAQSG